MESLSYFCILFEGGVVSLNAGDRVATKELSLETLSCVRPSNLGNAEIRDSLLRSRLIAFGLHHSLAAR